MTARLLLEEARLRVLFRRLVALSLTAAPLGCSSADDSSPRDASTQPDSTVAGDAGGDGAISTSEDGAAGPSPDASAIADACAPVYVDGEADGSGCDFFESLACNLPSGTLTEGCAIELVTCTQICGQVEGFPCAVAECGDAGVIPSGPITVECTTGKAGCADGGRRPAGLEEVRVSPGEVGEWLARVAWMEAASVHAFRMLGLELEAFGAPASLVSAAERARRDEVKHARMTSRLARRRGGRPARARVKPREERSLEAFARENAVEGCVREAFAALVATWQASHAPDAEIARAMEEIARDETRHAALALAVAAWVEPELDAASRRGVQGALRGALRALRCEMASLPVSFARGAGLPSGGPRGQAVALVDAFAAALLA